MPQTDSYWSPSATNMVHRHQNRNHQHRFNVYFLTSPGSASTSLIFLGCNHPQAFQQHYDIFGHDHNNCMGWPGTHKPISDETVQCFLSSATVPTCCGVDDDQDLVSLRNLFGCLERYPAVTKRLWIVQTDIRQLICLISPTFISHTVGTTLMIRRRVRVSFDAIVFKRCPRKFQVRLLVSRTWFRYVEIAPCNTLTQWGRDKMAAVSQTTLSNAFSWMKILEFRLKCHRSLFRRVQLTIIQHWFR